MHYSDKNRFDEVSEKIAQAKESLENVEELDVPKTLEMGFVDQIPLGQFPEDEAKIDKKED